MIDSQRNIDARAAILESIREHLAASIPYNAVHAETLEEMTADLDARIPAQNGNQPPKPAANRAEEDQVSRSLLEIFSENLEAAGGHCIIVPGEHEVSEAITRIISALQTPPMRARRIALSNAPVLLRVISQMEIDAEEMVVTPTATELFDYDVGITAAQSAIAETGTLVLESEAEKHRLISLVPPVHIAIVDSKNICLTLGEVLADVNRDSELSPTITFITGPSRTADIELTLAIGVHGPQELYVVINDASSA